MPYVCLFIPILFALAFQPVTLFERLWSEGQDQLKQAEYTQAERTLRSAVREGGKAGVDETVLALTINDLAEACSRTGNYVEAQSLYNQAIAILRKGSDLWRLVVVLNNQGRLYGQLGMEVRSASAFAEARAISKKARIENTPLVAAALGGLADGRSSEGDLRGAEQYLRQSLNIRENTLGAEHLDVAETLNNLAVIHAQTNKYAQAEREFRRALKINQRVLGIHHPDVAAILDNLGVLHNEREEYTEAEKLLRKALDIRRGQVPPDHAALGKGLTHLAHVMMNTQRTSEAEQVLREALMLMRNLPPGLDHQLALTLESYALALRLNGHAADAAGAQSEANFLRAKSKYVLRR
jgi:tetratricopeptide (TPR) repeat protein